MLTAARLCGDGQAGMLSGRDAVDAFDRGPMGWCRREAVAVVVLKRLSQAQADGDEIHALIRGSGINYDGHTNGMRAPNGAAQAQLLRRCYRARGGECGSDRLHRDARDRDATGRSGRDQCAAGGLWGESQGAAVLRAHLHQEQPRVTALPPRAW